MYKIILVFMFFVLNNELFSQENSDDTTITGTTTNVISDLRLNTLKETYNSTYKLMGYRIQIYSGSKKQPARDTRLTFTKMYSKIKAHEMYEQPYFKVRVGDFRTKIEALKFKNELVKYFPNCFIVNDEIDFKEISN